MYILITFFHKYHFFSFSFYFRILKTPLILEMTSKLIEEYKTLIHSIGICDSVKNINIDAYNKLCELFKNHPEYPYKIRDMVDLCIKKNKLNFKAFELNIIREDGSIEDISYRSCIVKRPLDYNLKQAMRYSISPQILEFKNKSNLICSFCNSTENLEIDHIKLFKELYDDFIKQNTNIPTIFDDNTYNGAMFKKEDVEFEEKWRNYHKDNATLRVLCKKCNCSRNKK